MRQHQAERGTSLASRWGGAILALGALAYVVAVSLYVVLYGQPVATGPGGEATLADRVAHLQGRWRLAQTMWFVEMLAAVLIAIAGFVLQHRTTTVRTALPPRVAWTTVGVGAVLLALMYAFMLGGYPDAAAAFGEEPALFAALNGIATFLFNFGTAVVFFGLAGAFAAEIAPQGVVSRPLALAGVAFSLLGTVVALGMLVGVGAMEAAAPVGLVGFLLTAYLGLSIWRKGLPAGEGDALSWAEGT